MMAKIHPRDSLRHLLGCVKSTDVPMGPVKLSTAQIRIPTNWTKVLRFAQGTKMRADDFFEVKYCYAPQRVDEIHLVHCFANE